MSSEGRGGVNCEVSRERGFQLKTAGVAALRLEQDLKEGPCVWRVWTGRGGEAGRNHVAL